MKSWLWCGTFLLCAQAGLAAPVWEMPFPGKPVPFLEWARGTAWKEQMGSARPWKFDGQCLRMNGKGKSVTVGSAKGFPMAVDDGLKAVFAFVVDKAPEQADLGDKTREDAALRVFLIFDRSGGFLKPPQTLGYAFVPGGKIDEVIPSERFGSVKSLVVANELRTDVRVERSIAADYRVAFGRNDVPALKAIGLKSDGNDTNAEVAACLKALRLERSPQ